MAVSSHMTIRDICNARSSCVRVYNILAGTMEKLEDAVKTASAEFGYLSLKEKQLEVITSYLVVMFAVDVTFYDVMCIPRGQADGTLFIRPFLAFCVALGVAGARD